MRNIILSISILSTLAVSAQNPVIRDQFAADPTARVFNNKVYVYPSHDIPAPEGQRQDWFCMADYHVFSSENLTDWTDHGVILSQEQVPWGKTDAYSMWAPDCVYKNGKYYFYFPNAPKDGRGFAVGVAIANQPEGPFTCVQEPIMGISGIDPCVLIDDDCSAYIYWSGMGIRGARLKENMLELDGELQEVKIPKRDGMPEMPPMKMGGQVMEGLPDGFKEGPFAFKRNGWYYLTFPWVRGNTSNGANPTETLAYAMSKSPLGPWDFKGIIMAEHDNHCWTNHHSILEYKGQWYIFYHRNDFSPNMDKRRSTRIEKIAFNSDGTIQEVKQTMRGVGINQAVERIEIDRYSSASNDVTTQLIDTVNTFRSFEAILSQKGSWLRYNDIDFNSVTDAYLVVNVKAADNTEFFVREKSAKGKIIAKVPMTVKSETRFPGSPTPFRRDQSNQWLTMTVPMEYLPKGVTDIVITNEGNAAFSINWIQFKNRPKYFSPVPATAAPSQPDQEGFIRRWRLLEPIAVDVRSNVVFTYSWLRHKFGEELAKFNTNSKKGKWYVMDSETYNMKLFRFAEKYGKQTYGSFYWCETVIDSPEEMRNVRLACGSNGASLWWLNGEEVLMLEGDRRMVEDDGMSPRLTLKKGRNTLRVAVINGPGLSDMCARFIDEKGKPITDYNVKVQ
ncbi:family 43 glycosylhydrolase [Prevotella sp. tf2-5]|uniref:family 43 glycosylhydrolase n=1 Tax=Prevotella sp. tf2-5 TaxID=1761889 RepID=UPI0008E3196E|nr:family 43 glycosylhydrolase [Prevotella sp. tf2-5]SFO43782.1 Carbohydrate binding module (family 6) [Prevotella sp. tf2-5]